MNVAMAVTWNDTKKPRKPAAALTASLIAISLALPSFQVIPQTARELISVIVRELPGSQQGPEEAVERLGGRVGDHLGIIDSFVAEVPSTSLAALRETPGVHSVTPNGKMRPLANYKAWGGIGNDFGSTRNIARVIGVRRAWSLGFWGQGIDVALIDTGVVPVTGLMTNVVNGPDLSFESQDPDLRYLDTNGHGTHMAGIIAGNDTPSLTEETFKGPWFTGMAPGARLLNVKVGASTGAVDVSQVIAAIDWVVQHRQDPGLNVRVLNLSFGTDSGQDYRLDPLAYAAEVAWRKGIVVVAAGGNAGIGSGGLKNPAYNPYMIAVGAADPRDSLDTADDVVTDFSSRGAGGRNPDIVAPGKSVLSLRNPGSYIDVRFETARYGDRYFRGSGTSQAAAVVAGSAAVLLSQRPNLTPDQVKRIFTSTATPLSGAGPADQGAGQINVEAAISAPTPSFTQTWPQSTGTGSLDAARGSARLSHDGVELAGEQDIFGDPWDGVTWSRLAWEGRTWSGGDWMGRTWSGSCWCAITWSGVTWSGVTWSGVTWSGRTWSGVTWSENVWDGRTWSAGLWDGGPEWNGSSWGRDMWTLAPST